MTEYDCRQLKKMRQQISAFEAQQLGLGPLIADLEFLLNAMESVDKRWRQQVSDQVFILEEIYADALDNSDPNSLTQESQLLVSSTINKIKMSLNNE